MPAQENLRLYITLTAEWCGEEEFSAHSEGLSVLIFSFLNQKTRLLPSVVATDLQDVVSKTEHVLQDVCSLVAALLSLTPACHFLIHLMKTEGSLLYDSQNVM